MQHRFHALDSFRGIAAVLVVIHHMHYFGSITEIQFFIDSSLFVEFFFVLSGFVLAHAYAFRKKLLFKHFFIARTFRIMPLHIAILSVFILLEFGKLLIYHYGMPFNVIPFTNHNDPLTIVPNLLLLQSWLPNTMATGWNSPSWSISIEYYMYMIFFMTLLIKKPGQYVVWLFISIIFFYFIFSEIDLWNNFDKISRGLSCFFAGTLVYIVYKNVFHLVKIDSFYFTLLEVSILLSIIWVVPAHIAYKTLIISLLFCLQVFIFAFEKGIISRVLNKSFFQLLGKLSYSIYMLHTLILFILISAIMIIQKILKIDLIITVKNSVYIDFGSTFYNNLIVFIILFFVIFCSYFTYKYIEQTGQVLGKKIIS